MSEHKLKVSLPFRCYITRTIFFFLRVHRCRDCHKWWICESFDGLSHGFHSWCDVHWWNHMSDHVKPDYIIGGK